MLLYYPGAELFRSLKSNPAYTDLFNGQEGIQNFAYCVALCLDDLGMGFCHGVLHGRYVEYNVRNRLIAISKSAALERYLFRYVNSFIKVPIDGWTLNVLPQTITLVFENKQE